MAKRSKRTGKTALESAREKYAEAIKVGERVLVTLRAEKDALTEETHWGHDGDAGAAWDDLKRLSDRLHDEGEYADEDDS